MLEPATAAMVLPMQLVQAVLPVFGDVPAWQTVILPSWYIEPVGSATQERWSTVTRSPGQPVHVEPAVAAIVFPEQAIQAVPAALDVVPAAQGLSWPLLMI